MQNNQNSSQGRDMASIVLACLFILGAFIALWDTTTMLDSDSYVFPRAIAIALILFCLILIVWNLLQPATGKKKVDTDASSVRRMALIVVILISCAAMPWLGFLFSGMVTFLLLMFVSMYDEWTPGRRLIYPLVAVAIVAGFYILFSKLLLVPLPVGLLFE
jgi:heme A synthase